MKLQQCLELLVAAGYFRARIQGLPPFDKIVGGMAWCIETCCIDLDVDLMYHDSLTIGQKISLTERLVSVLPVLQCPNTLQPHQVQGLDTTHILPVMQWLVREALSRRAQYGSVSRAVAALHCPAPLSAAPPPPPQHLLHDLNTIQCGYECVRRWRVKGGTSDALPPQQRVHTTLLEYGPLGGDNIASRGPAAAAAQSGVDGAQLQAVLGQQQDTADSERQLLLGRLQHLPQQQGNGLLSSALLQAAATATPHRPAASVKPTVAGMSEQVSGLKLQLSSLQLQATEEQRNKEQLQQQVEQAKQQLQQFKSSLHKLQADNSMGGVSSAGVEELRHLVEEAERIKKKEHRYKDECRQHVTKLKEEISTLEERANDIAESSPSPALLSLAVEERAKCARARSAAAVAARRLAALRRAWDDVPGRAELAQYRHRLTELNDLVMTSERETHQFHTMYNTLLDSRTAMEKHLALLNDILDNIQPGVKSVQTSVQLLQQVEAVLQTVHHNKDKVCAERAQQDAVHGEASARLAALQEAARLYARTAHALANQINKNQQLRDAATD